MKNRLIGWKKDEAYWRRKAVESVRELVEEVSILEENLQKIHTPWPLCGQILDRLDQEASLKGCERIAVLFNLEFVQCLIERGINPRRIWFFADASLKGKRAKEWYGVNVLNISYDSTKKKGERISIMPKPKKQFDVVIMNPPYQPPTKKNAKNGGSGSRNAVWPKFVDLALNLVPDGGFVAAVHPVTWRKPDNEMFPVIIGNRIHYLEMHTKQDGIKTFGASTPFDWYILQKASPNGEVVVKDTNGKTHNLDLTTFPFLPNFDLKLVQSLLAGPNDEKCEVLFSRSMYGSDKDWMREDKTSRFKHCCVHSTPRSGVRYWYSSKKGGFFGVSKIIFGEADTIQNAVVDADGEYGITQQSIGITILSERNGEQIKKALESERFNELLQGPLRWSQFRIDWRMFQYFRKDFWKDFV